MGIGVVKGVCWYSSRYYQTESKYKYIDKHLKSNSVYCSFMWEFGKNR